MEIIDVELNDFTLRCRSLLVSHADASLGRGLEPGEEVVLHDRVLGHYTAHVSDLGFEPADTLYRLTLGVRLTEDEARERVLGASVASPRPVTRQDLLDLLGRLRADGRTIPAARHRRTDTAL